MSDKQSPAPGPANAKLCHGSITGHLVGQTLPAIIGVAAMMSIGLVDSYFIGQLGSDALAAISFIFPVSVALTSLGVGVMVGINSVVARALGEGNDEKAAYRGNFGVVLAAAIGLTIGLVLYASIDPLFRLMNAPSHILPLITLYMEPFSLGFPLILAIMGINGVMRGQGEARKTSAVSITFAAVNWILDPLLITGAFGFSGFGIVGAAYATVIGWLVGGTLAFYLLGKTSIPLNISRIQRGRMLEPTRAIVRVAGPAAFSNAINPIGLSILTALVALQGEAAVAGFGAAGRLQSFATVPLLALSGSIGAIVGQNWGARQYDRSRQAALYAFGFCIAWGTLLIFIMIPLSRWFGGIFSEDQAVIDQFALYLNIAAWGYAGFGLLIVGNGILNAVGKASFALSQSVARVFLVMLPFAWLLTADWGSSAIYAAELSANLFGAVTSIALIYWVLQSRAPDQMSRTAASRA